MALANSRIPFRIPLSAAAVVVLLDFLSKEWAEKHLDGYPGMLVLWRDHLTLILARNRGGAWGLLHTPSEAVRRPFFTIVALVSVAFTLWVSRRLRRYQGLAAVGLGLVLGCGLGNIFDRIRIGYVIDFIDYQADWLRILGGGNHWPTFNVGEGAAVLGSALFLVGVNAIPNYGAPLPIFFSFRSARSRRGTALRIATLPFQFAALLLLKLGGLALDALSKDDEALRRHPDLSLGASLAIPLLSIGLVTPLLVTMAAVWYRGRRLSQPTLEELRGLDSRSPVLFLRAFFRDAQRIAPRHWIWQWVPIGKDISSYFPWTFEDALVDRLMWVGPPVALGHPGEKVPSAGAARAYVPDHAWTERIRRLASEAQLLVVVVDYTQSLQWEIQTLLDSAYRSRVILVLPPDGRGRGSKRSASWYEAWERMRIELGSLPAVNDRAAAVVFSDAGEPRTIAAKSARAWHIVDALERELEARLKRLEANPQRDLVPGPA